jgi:indole-3-glycerol phosphate synthase
MNILSTIAAHKKAEVAKNKELCPIAILEGSVNFHRQPLSMTDYLLRGNATGIIAEFKRQSPSKGIINITAKPEEVSIGYILAGATALSVLTDSEFFGGSNADLVKVRAVNSNPVLRKDFMVDPYQIFEAKSIGADAILLIASILTIKETLQMATLARSLGLETILEVHNREELNHWNDQISILGVNNRNLDNFTVSLDVSLSLAEFIPSGTLAISESGIRTAEDLIRLKKEGYRGFLIGEQFMSTGDPVAAAREFIDNLKDKTK